MTPEALRFLADLSEREDAKEWIVLFRSFLNLHAPIEEIADDLAAGRAFRRVNQQESRNIALAHMEQHT